MPLWRSTVKVIRAWLKFNPDLTSTSALLPNRSGQAMTRSNVTQRLALAVKTAALTTPSLAGRTISPHCLRHSTAMHLLQSGVDISVIALWLGHESPTTTHQYVEADLAMKEKALARLQDPNVAPRRFRADDDLLKCDYAQFKDVPAALLRGRRRRAAGPTAHNCLLCITLHIRHCRWQLERQQRVEGLNRSRGSPPRRP